MVCLVLQCAWTTAAAAPPVVNGDRTQVRQAAVEFALRGLLGLLANRPDCALTQNQRGVDPDDQRTA